MRAARRTVATWRSTTCILKVNGVTVTSAADASRMLQKIAAGGRAALLVWKTRQGEQQWLTIKKGIAGPSPLTPLLLSRIRDHGRLTVAEFVETALYHETLGYYARAGQRSGREGDFFTSVDLGPLFGELLATQFAEMQEALSGVAASGRPEPDPPRFDLVEAAAGNGRLARDVLDAAERHHPPFYRAVRLHLVGKEPSGADRTQDRPGPARVGCSPRRPRTCRGR